MRILIHIIQFALIMYISRMLGDILPEILLSLLRLFSQIILFGHVTAWIITFTQDYMFTSTIEPKNKAVLITGCDSGFGNAFAKRLDNKGFKVFACCLDPNSDGANTLKDTCSNNMEVIDLNVTQDESVKKVFNTVQNHLEDLDLWAVVNNAGALKGFAFELTKMEDIEEIIQINTLGPVRVTKAFLPLLRKSRGRVVNVNSRAGRVSNIYFGPYDMSKYASVAFTEVLMQEAREFGIHVISVEPEFFRTRMSSKEYLDKVFESAFQDMDQETKDAYGQKYIEQATNIYRSLSMLSPGDMDIVIDVLEKAICLRNPANVYQPCRNLFMTFSFFLAERVPRILKDLFFIAVLFVSGVPAPRMGLNRLSKILLL